MNTLLYARVSTDRQAQKDLSIPAQLSAMKEFAKKKGWKVIGTYIDAGESAKTANRPELKKLMRRWPGLSRPKLRFFKVHSPFFS